MLISGWKAFGVLAITSTISLGWMKNSLLSAEKTIATQQTKIVQYKNNNDKLEEAIGEQRNTVKAILSINEKAGERIYVLTNKQQQAMDVNATLNEEINNLRQTEANLALEKPYGRGNAAGERINSIMRGIGGTTLSKDSRDTHNTNNTQD